MTAALEIERLSVSYGGILALREATLEVREREMVALIGPNGAGKTTMLNAASGLVRARSGRVRLFGETLTGRAGHEVARSGLLQVPEGRRVLGPMSVLENLLLGAEALGARRADASTLDRVFDLFPILADRRAQLAGSLSGGQQQMLAIGRALMGAPRVLLLDEPSLGLSPLLAEQVFTALATLNRDGLTMLLVEQNAARALACTSRAYVLEGGRVVHGGPSLALAADPAISAHYLGIAPDHQRGEYVR